MSISIMGHSEQISNRQYRTTAGVTNEYPESEMQVNKYNSAVNGIEYWMPI
jgi:hypothetical protein